MKKRFLIGAVLALALVATSILVVNRAGATPCRVVELKISGPEGQRFRGTYTADGATNSLSAVAPATVSFHAREATFELLREGGQGEFRVALYADGLARTSTTSHQQAGVRGKCTDTAWWAEAFSN